jgi:hypothetical protein
VFSGDRVYMLQLRYDPSDGAYSKLQVYLDVFDREGAALSESVLPIKFEDSRGAEAPPGLSTDFSAAIRPALVVRGDRIYATDPGNHRVLILGLTGRVLGTAAAGFLPGGLAFDRRGDLFVSDPGHRRILVFGYHGRVIRRIRFKDRWSFPTSMTCARGGAIDVLDIGALRVEEIDQNGRTLAVSPPLPDEWFTHISTGPNGVLCLANHDLTFLKS